MIFLLIFSWCFISISSLMIINYICNIFISAKYLAKGKNFLNKEIELDKQVKMLILIPALREQNSILDTIRHFESMNSKNLQLSLCIACTKREINEKNKYNYKETTFQIVQNYINNKNNSYIELKSYEADDIDFGDRATQLNFSLTKCIENNTYDVVGVFDADSRPTINTLLEVASRFLDNNNISMQQPAFFLDAASKMRINKENPLLIANALYQNTWTVISEIPMWHKYEEKKGKGNGNFYFIGHGEFFPTALISHFTFPEREVTDGIQIGYRLAMSGKDTCLLDNYCSDDVPHNLVTLIQQHKRWYGGCQRLLSSYKWCLKEEKKAKFTTVLTGAWSQFRWAYTAIFFILNLVASIYLLSANHSWINLILSLLIFILYCYVLPFYAFKITPAHNKIPLLSYILLPVSIFIKSIGPNLYFIEKIFRKKISYKKVER